MFTIIMVGIVIVGTFVVVPIIAIVTYKPKSSIFMFTYKYPKNKR